jgi:predicted nucleotidyltransferase component of viral defense system
MKVDELKAFRLVGGTALSLQLGHRESIDIDLFTDIDYRTVDFDAIDKYLQENFPFMRTHTIGGVGLGKAYWIGESETNHVKLDLYYTDSFIRPALCIDDIRLAAIEDIIAMKIDVVQNVGRKKDFWDLHELIDQYSIDEMIALHEKRYPYSHEENLIISNLTNFTQADEEANPTCMRGKYWEVIKWDFVNLMERR